MGGETESVADQCSDMSLLTRGDEIPPLSRHQLKQEPETLIPKMEKIGDSWHKKSNRADKLRSSPRLVALRNYLSVFATGPSIAGDLH
ncbi:hypothetical protein OIDMADRAFT_18132 [Oidiodendron maius Zn]|uniref:Uncharacterized protein n=1 Tax=Oidiodendron maius (strain Zn) TaxID=913774 RepID=A0A0C3DPL0_OIDMZ|nr:hypothetical protein OIDMADRAFT_18132 [Oidiodendron maius Zn]